MYNGNCSYVFLISKLLFISTFYFKHSFYSRAVSVSFMLMLEEASQMSGRGSGWNDVLALVWDSYRERTSDNLCPSGASAASESHAATDVQDEQGAKQNESEAFGKSWTIDSLTVAVVIVLL